MHRAGFERGQRVGDAETDIVVRMDADFAIQFADRSFRDGGDFLRQATAVRVAKDDKIRARFFRGLPGGERVFGVEFIAVEACSAS